MQINSLAIAEQLFYLQISLLDLRRSRSPVPPQSPVLAIIKSFDGSTWKSCQSATGNFCKSYLKIPAVSKIFVATENDSPTENARLAADIKSIAPTHLIFTDYDPHPLGLIQELDLIWSRDQWPEIIFHIFGDFTLKTNIWRKLEPLLLGKKILFLTASPRYATVLSQFIDPRLLRVCEYPVDTRFFKNNKNLRSRQRKKLGLLPTDILLTYSGRLALQKNVQILLELFLTIMKDSDQNIYFAIAGPFDSLVAPAFGFSKLKGNYFKSLRQMLYSHDRVKYLGNLNADQLVSLYNATDVLVSLSTHHDEEFGMAIGESLCCGTKALVSDWGGYAAFAEMNSKSSAVSLLPVHTTKNGLQLETGKANGYVTSFSHSQWNGQQRLKSSESFGHKLSIEATSEKLKLLIRKSKSPFKGFSIFHHQHANKISAMFRNRQIYGEKFWTDPDYHKIYGAFGSGNPTGLK